MSEQNNEPAFPVQDASAWQAHGMTLRDYFAAKAMQSFILDPSSLNGFGWDHISAGAYQLADAMLAARNNDNQGQP